MSRTTDIYEHISRALLENFTWQLQNTVVDYEREVEGGRAAEASVSLHYAFECPTEEAAGRLRDYIHEQSDDEISIEPAGRAWTLHGRVEEFSFGLPLLLRWVGYMCDAGTQVECRFDGWNPNRPVKVAESPASHTSPAATPAPTPAGPQGEYPHRVIARIVESLEPIDRGSQYEDPLSGVLKLKGLGQVTGGGSQLNAQGVIDYVELEISLANLDDALALTKRTLRQLGAPKGSELHVLHTSVMPIVD